MSDNQPQPYGQGDKPEQYISSGRYDQDVMRNVDPDAYHPDKVCTEGFATIIDDVVVAGRDLDRVKKALIYGKQDPFVSGVPGEDPDLSISSNFCSIPPEIVHAVIGMATETAEMIEAIQETLLSGKPFDTVNFLEEIGDNMWYAALGCRALGRGLDDAAWANTKKLAIRYPEKFTADRALTRNIEAERSSLEDSAEQER